MPEVADALRLLDELEAATDDDKPDCNKTEDDDDRWNAFQTAIDALGSEITLYCGLDISTALGPLAGIDERELLWTSGARYFSCTDDMMSYLDPAQVTTLAARLAPLSPTDIHHALKGNPRRRAPVRDVINESEALLKLIRTAADSGQGLLVQFDC